MFAFSIMRKLSHYQSYKFTKTTFSSQTILFSTEPANIIVFFSSSRYGFCKKQKHTWNIQTDLTQLILYSECSLFAFIKLDTNTFAWLLILIGMHQQYTAPLLHFHASYIRLTCLCPPYYQMAFSCWQKCTFDQTAHVQKYFCSMFLYKNIFAA